MMAARAASPANTKLCCTGVRRDRQTQPLLYFQAPSPNCRPCGSRAAPRPLEKFPHTPQFLDVRRQVLAAYKGSGVRPSPKLSHAAGNSKSGTSSSAKSPLRLPAVRLAFSNQPYGFETAQHIRDPTARSTSFLYLFKHPLAYPIPGALLPYTGAQRFRFQYIQRLSGGPWDIPVPPRNTLDLTFLHGGCHGEAFSC